jgi:RimJ/RimL family protein N-acetyltransferase
MKATASHLSIVSNPDASQLAQLRLRIAGRLQQGLRSSSMRFGLRRDLDVPLERPTAKIPIAIRPLIDSDVPSLLSINNAQSDGHDKLEIAWRRAFLDRKGAKGCFVGVDLRNDSACYMQWLMSSADNDFIASLGGFPQLRKDEALLENAYTPANYRGLGIMSAAMTLIAERAVDFGARYVLTFVDEQNAPSLKGCERSGFYPHLLHHRSQMCFGVIRKDRFETLLQRDPRRAVRFCSAAGNGGRASSASRP